jgi:hypothetical protein
MIAASERPSAGPRAKSAAGIAVLGVRGYPIAPVMDGYSVQEAASVLGVAEGRVWELLARGVLVGTPEGDSMRVFLKGQAGPIATTAARDDPPRSNGNGGTHGSTAEASAFRELLTEFRNLTERYGQALLALGEARGEVAGLRSRVDLLEARLDVRMPPSFDEAPLAWEPRNAATIAPEATPTIPAPLPPTERVRKAKPTRRAAPSRTTRSNRDAVAGFAAALERAQDPNPAHLAEASETAEGETEALAPPIAEVVPAVEPLPEVEVEAEPVTAAAELAAEEAPAAEVAEEIDAESVVEEISAEAAPDEEVPAEEISAEAPPDDAIPAIEAVPEEAEALGAVAVTPEVAEGEAPTAEIADEVAAESPPDEVAAESPPDEVAAEAEAPTYSTVVVEPDWFADGDFAWLDAAGVEAQGDAEPVAVTGPAQAQPEAEAEAIPTGEPEPIPEAVAEPEPEPEPRNLQEAAAPPEKEPTPESEPTLEPDPDPAAQLQSAFEPEIDFEPWQPPEPTVLQPVAPEIAAEPATEQEPARAPEPPTMSTAVAVEDLEEEEVMWLGGQPEATAVVRDLPPAAPRAEAGPWPAVDTVRPPLAMTEDELARLALDEGWDDAEVAAIRAMISPPPHPAVDLPGAAELHKAMAALEAVPVRADPTFDISRQWAKPASGADQPPTYDDWGFETEPTPRPAPPARPAAARDVTSALRQAANDPGWLGRRAGPAAAAYRRLRRFFPG